MISSREDLGINPFLINFVVPVDKLQHKGKYYEVYDSELESTIKLPVEYLVEKRKYVRLYPTSDRRKMLMTLSSSANKLYVYILYKIENSRDYFYLNKNLFMKESSMSLNTFKKAEKELRDKLVMTTTNIKDVYWINPNLFFKGNPINTFSDCLTIVHDATE